jgi:hypothetical protein
MHIGHVVFSEMVASYAVHSIAERHFIVRTRNVYLDSGAK